MKGTALSVTCWAILATAFLWSPAPGGEKRVIVDSAGRRVEVPERVERVFAAGPPASIFVYTLAPHTLLGWYRPLTLDERSYIPAQYADLPTLGKLTGRSNTPNVEVVRDARPDVILDYGTVNPINVSLADRIQRETGVPYVLLDGSLSAIPGAYRVAGDLLGVPGRASELARYAEGVLAAVDRRAGGVPPEKRPRVYYARGPLGLQTELIESLDRLGVTNVAAGHLERGALVTVPLEQILAWDPEIIVTVAPAFSAAVRSDPGWQRVRAVRDGRIHLAPLLPFAWLDLPPSVNRLLGLRWLGRSLYPELFPEDLRQEAREFISLFYHREPDERQLDGLLGEAARASR